MRAALLHGWKAAVNVPDVYEMVQTRLVYLYQLIWLFFPFYFFIF